MAHQILHLPDYPLKIRKSGTKGTEVFDPFRKKYVRLTPEERVRQRFLLFLQKTKRYPASLVAVEKAIMVNGMPRRFDAVIFNPSGKPLLLLEFKAPTVKLAQSVFDQVAAYNLLLHADYLIVSNGISHYCCQMDYSAQRYHFLPEIPDFSELQ